MKNETKNKLPIFTLNELAADRDAQAAFPAYPIYNPDEDIYNQSKEVDINPEEITEDNVYDENGVIRNIEDSSEAKIGDDLDIPGSELDDRQEDIGSEDEENNYYSLGDNDPVDEQEIITAP